MNTDWIAAWKPIDEHHLIFISNGTDISNCYYSILSTVILSAITMSVINKMIIMIHPRSDSNSNEWENCSWTLIAKNYYWNSNIREKVKMCATAIFLSLNQQRDETYHQLHRNCGISNALKGRLDGIRFHAMLCFAISAISLYWWATKYVDIERPACSWLQVLTFFHLANSETLNHFSSNEQLQIAASVGTLFLFAFLCGHSWWRGDANEPVSAWFRSKLC